MSRYDTEADRALRAFLRAHWKAKYGTLVRAADFIGCKPQFLTAVHKGRKRPNAKILADAGVQMTLTQVMTWECLSKRSR